MQKCLVENCEGHSVNSSWFPDSKRDDPSTFMDGYLVIVSCSEGHSWPTTGYKDKALKLLKPEFGGIR